MTDLLKFDPKSLSPKLREFREYQADLVRRAQEAQDTVDWQEAQRSFPNQKLLEAGHLKS